MEKKIKTRDPRHDKTKPCSGHMAKVQTCDDCRSAKEKSSWRRFLSYKYVHTQLPSISSSMSVAVTYLLGSHFSTRYRKLSRSWFKFTRGGSHGQMNRQLIGDWFFFSLFLVCSFFILQNPSHYIWGPYQSKPNFRRKDPWPNRYSLYMIKVRRNAVCGSLIGPRQSCRVMCSISTKATQADSTKLGNVVPEIMEQPLLA